MELALAEDVRFAIEGLKLIHHLYPLILVGSDVLSGGRAPGQINYTGLRLVTDEKGVVSG